MVTEGGWKSNSMSAAAPGPSGPSEDIRERLRKRLRDDPYDIRALERTDGKVKTFLKLIVWAQHHVGDLGRTALKWALAALYRETLPTEADLLLLREQPPPFFPAEMFDKYMRLTNHYLQRKGQQPLSIGPQTPLSEDELDEIFRPVLQRKPQLREGVLQDFGFALDPKVKAKPLPRMTTHGWSMIYLKHHERPNNTFDGFGTILTYDIPRSIAPLEHDQWTSIGGKVWQGERELKLALINRRSGLIGGYHISDSPRDFGPELSYRIPCDQIGTREVVAATPFLSQIRQPEGQPESQPDRPPIYAILCVVVFVPAASKVTDTTTEGSFALLFKPVWIHPSTMLFVGPKPRQIIDPPNRTTLLIDVESYDRASRLAFSREEQSFSMALDALFNKGLSVCNLSLQSSGEAAAEEVQEAAAEVLLNLGRGATEA